MKRLIKKTQIVILMSLLLCIVFNGCVRIGDSNDDMIKYMNKKYNGYFEFAGYFGGHLGSNTHMIFVTCDSFPDKILVQTIKQGNKIIFSDNYVSVARKEETKEYVKEAFSSIYGDCKIYEDIQPIPIPDTISVDDPITDLTDNPRTALNFYFYLPETADFSNKDQDIIKLEKEFAEKNIILDGLIHYCSSEQEYAYVTEDNYAEAFQTSENRSTGFIVNRDHQICDVRWR